MAPVQEVHNCIDLFWWRQRVVVFGRHGREVCMFIVAVKKMGMALLSVLLAGMGCRRSCEWGRFCYFVRRLLVFCMLDGRLWLIS